MGPMFSDTRSEVISGGNMFGAVGYLQCNPGQRVVPYITGDETWIHHWDSDTKQSRCSGDMLTLLHPGSSALNFG